MAAHAQRNVWNGMMAVIAIAFGLVTIKEGGTVLFGNEAARTAAGNYVPFVLWFNFLAGFAYVIAGAGLWLQRRWARGAPGSPGRRPPEGPAAPNGCAAPASVAGSQRSAPHRRSTPRRRC